MSEEVTKEIQDVDRMFQEIEVNGQSFTSDNYVPPVVTQTPPAEQQLPSDPQEPTDPTHQGNQQGENVNAIDLNNVIHDIEDKYSRDTVETVQTDIEGINLGISEINSKIPEQATSENKLADKDFVTDAIQDSIETVQASIDDINALIPEQATETNKLADKNFVNSTVGTNTANYISDDGEPFTSLADLEAYSGTVTNNDYAFITGTDSEGNTYFDRYKATVSGSSVSWAKEYRLNNSSFTAQQWATINSGITQSSLDNKADISYVDSGLAGKATLSDIATAIQNSNRPNIFEGNIDTDAPVGWISYADGYTGGTLPTGYGSIITVVGANAWYYQLAFGTNDTVWFRESINQSPYGAWSQIANTSAISSLLSNADVRSSIVLSGEDTRNVNSPVDYYYDYLKGQVLNGTKIMCEFKQLSTIGINNEGIYGLLITLIPWTDDSGGNIIQIVFSESALYYRRSASFGSSHIWTAWYLVPYMNDSFVSTNITWSSSKINSEIQNKQFLDVYSTTETRIGTWVDGKPIYRIVVNNIFLTGQFNLNFVSNNIDVIMRCNVLSSSGNGYTTDKSTTDGSSNSRVDSWFNGGFLTINATDNKYVKAVIIEYTKTTD